MTPRAKWARLDAKGTYASGNGWLQNSSGAWSYDEENSALKIETETGFEDTFDPFKVVIESDSVMVWEREEEEQKVTVFYKRIQEIPKNLPDIMTGIWDLESADLNGKDVMKDYDPAGNRFLFLRWDHLFIDFTNEGRLTGIWRVDAHSPTLDILYYNNSEPQETWKIRVKGEDQLTWSREDEGLELVFSRLTSFPE
jgi:hypothetical protein